MEHRTAKPSVPPADDPYAALGLTKTATDADVKKAFRRLARKSHPDINPDDPEAAANFVRITAAHNLLKAPATRARFDAGEIDAAGHEKPRQRYSRDASDTERSRQTTGGFGGINPDDDIFAEIFRRHMAGEARSAKAPGRDHAYTLDVPFLDAARGGKSRITLPSGGVLDVRIPVGFRDGQTLRLRGKGGDGIGGGPPGDAEVKVRVRPHPLFRRVGDNILITLPITLDEAVLGARIQVPTISGDVSVTIPKGSSSGKVLRLRGRGVLGTAELGDQLVGLRIVVPADEDQDLTAFLQEWQKSRHEDPRKAMLDGLPR